MVSVPPRPFNVIVSGHRLQREALRVLGGFLLRKRWKKFMRLVPQVFGGSAL